MDLCKSDKQSRWQSFKAGWTRRNWVTDIFLYGIQIASVLYGLVIILELVDIVLDFYSPNPFGLYESMTLGGMFFRMLSKGWLVGLFVCIVVFFCNRRVIKWGVDGVLWMFLLFFGISLSTLAVEEEMFLCFGIFSIGPLAIYFLSLFLPKRIGDLNMTTYQQCRKPKNWLITTSFIIMLLWIFLLYDIISRL